MNGERIQNPVLADTALLGRGLPSIDNNLIDYMWPDRSTVFPYMEEGFIKWAVLEEILKVRNRNSWQRIDARALNDAQEQKTSGYLTASALMALSPPGSLVVTAGMGGITGQRISQDLITLAQKPLCLIVSGFKDVVDARASFDFLKSQGIKVMGWRNRVYDGFLFADQDYVLDGILAEDNLNDLKLADNTSILVINPIPDSLKMNDKKLLEFAGKQMDRLWKTGEDFHPVVNQILDDETKGRASLIQLVALTVNVNLAVGINSWLGGKSWI